MATYANINNVAKRIHFIAMIIILISTFVAILSGLIIPYLLSIYIASILFAFTVMCVVPGLEVIGGIMSLVAGLTIFILYLITLLMGEYSTFFKVMLGLVGWGLMPLVAGVLFIISWLRSKSH